MCGWDRLNKEISLYVAINTFLYLKVRSGQLCRLRSEDLLKFCTVYLQIWLVEFLSLGDEITKVLFHVDHQEPKQVPVNLALELSE